MTWQLNRRGFLQVSAASAAYLIAGPAARAFDLNGKLRLAAIGTGRKGQDDLLNVAASPRCEVVALCDVDHSAELFGWAVEKYPKAEQYADFRRLLDKPDTFDAVTVSTPDHMHAPIAVAAMQLGKHVFCQKPLTHTVAEARRMREVAQANRIVTQMGNQIQSHPVYRTAVKLLQDGAIGKVREVHVVAKRRDGLAAEKWPSGGFGPDPEIAALGLVAGRGAGAAVQESICIIRRTGAAGRISAAGSLATLVATSSIRCSWDWGSAHRPRSKPKRRRSMTRFGRRTRPSPTSSPARSAPLARTCRSRGTTARGTSRSARRSACRAITNCRTPGRVSSARTGTMVIPHCDMPVLFPKEKFAEFKMPEVGEVNHYTSWVDACLGDGQTSSHFGYAGPLAEAVLLGRRRDSVPQGATAWDATGWRIYAQCDATARLTKEYREGWPNPLG